MKAEVVSVGDEVLLGEVRNSNAAFLGEELSSLGLEIHLQTSVGDDRSKIREGIRSALDRSQLIIVTGGLGPTEDDLTREAIADAAGLPLVENGPAKIWLEEWLQKRRGKISQMGQYKQCMMPKGAKALKNSVGSAPGFVLPLKDRVIVVLPGPPHEMKNMWHNQAKGWIVQAIGQDFEPLVVRQLMVCGMGEAEVNSRMRDWIRDEHSVHMAPYSSPGLVRLRLSIRGSDPTKAQEALDDAEKVARKRLGNCVYSSQGESLSEAVGKLLRKHNLTISCAESCTGGLVGSSFTDVPGSSEYFSGSLVCYSNQLKNKLLGVSNDRLSNYGAVSDEVAAAMAAGAMTQTMSRMAVSITGIAGPDGGSDEKPIGTVYFGLAISGKDGTRIYSWRRNFHGERRQIRERSVVEVFTSIYFFLTSTMEDPFWQERSLRQFSLSDTGVG